MVGRKNFNKHKDNKYESTGHPHQVHGTFLQDINYCIYPSEISKTKSNSGYSQVFYFSWVKKKEMNCRRFKPGRRSYYSFGGGRQLDLDERDEYRATRWLQRERQMQPFKEESLHLNLLFSAKTTSCRLCHEEDWNNPRLCKYCGRRKDCPPKAIIVTTIEVKPMENTGKRWYI